MTASSSEKSTRSHRFGVENMYARKKSLPTLSLRDMQKPSNEHVFRLSDEEGEMVAAMALLNEKPIGSLWKQSSNPRKKRNRAKTAQAVPRRRKSCDTHTIMPKFLSLSPRGHISKVHSSEQPRARRVPSTSQGGISPLSQKKLRLKRKILNRKKLLEQLPGICSLSAAYSESHLLIGIP
eukprot:TRINITY_DN1312_c0_g1_i2.p1 TRINITY_DN1312_c0_g1~~TRINITY_DN1312_c0_g1_i2.p1  ORF type:complete len:195 (-),score=10.90 TRINITY_DN1312_c0_g1_i2:217-756(-)